MKIAILTMFNGLSNTYSLVNVVSEQLKMFLQDTHISVKMLVSEHCPDSERQGVFKNENIEWIKIINSENNQIFHWETYTHLNKEVHQSFFHEAELISLDFIKHLKDVDVCILHDILYQGCHLVHNVAIRLAQEQLPNIQFLSFMHSAPVEYVETPYPISCMYSPMPNTTYIYPTQSGLKAMASQYQTGIEKCQCVNNSLDVLFNMNNETKNILTHMSYTQKEILIVYPARLTLAKKFHNIAIMGGYMKKYWNKKVGIIFCDFPSSDIDADLYKYMIKDIGIQNGLEEKDMIFTTDIGYPLGVKRETVLELFTLSNLFICPSYSESFGLTVIEAASRGNYIVLNEAVPALKEIGENINCYFMRWEAKNFGFNTQETYHPNENMYYINNTKQIITNMENNPVIVAKSLTRTRYSNEYIYQNQIKPLLEKKKE